MPLSIGSSAFMKAPTERGIRRLSVSRQVVRRDVLGKMDANGKKIDHIPFSIKKGDNVLGPRLLELLVREVTGHGALMLGEQVCEPVEIDMCVLWSTLFIQY